MFTFLFILILLPVSVSELTAQSIDETLAQIKALKKEIAQNENLLDKKIAKMKASNPLFADKDIFE
ncbi:uncharacterized protein METZ01_LOCUS386123, partial [marine metagenome]